MWVATENTTKKFFEFVKNPPTLANDFMKISRNAHKSDELLSTYYLHFARISSVRCFFIIVRE